MSHLTLEALARLLDEPPEGAERVHLGACASCREELAALHGQSDALAALPKMMPAPDAWPELRGRLLEEGLVAETGTPSAAAAFLPVRQRSSAGAMRAAAAVVLFVAGGALGWGVRGAAAPAAEAGTEVAAAEDVAGESAAGQTEAALPPAGLQEVEAAQEAFFTALDDYMAATSTTPPDPATRLATLDNIVLTTAEALNEAPADPVINSFHLTALAQRNAMLRQIATSQDPASQWR